MKSGDFELVRRSALFCDVPEERLRPLLAQSLVHSYPKGAVLFEQGGEAQFLHVILTGNVALVGEAPDGRETVVEILEPGEIFISAAVLKKRPYLMTARVVEDARILMVPSELLRQSLRSDPDLAVGMIESQALTFRRLVIHIKDLKLRSSEQRLGVYLLGLAATQDVSATEITLPFEKQLVAARLGMSPEHLSRAFSRLSRVGVTVRGKTVRVDDLEKLREFSQMDEITS